MENNIKQILEDIYSVDANLKKHEKELVEIIQALIASRPEASYDENFKIQLRSELLKKFNQIYNKNKEKRLLINFNFMNKLFYGLSIVALAVIVLLPNLLAPKQTPKQAQRQTTDVNFGLEVDEVKNNAFGSLSLNNSGQAAPSGLGSTESASDSSAQPVATGFGGGGTGAAKMDVGIMPPMEYYNYIYQGDEIKLEDKELPVYKKIRGLKSQAALAQMLQNSNFDSIDLEAFDNAKLTNFQISEDKNFGYTVWVDLYEGLINISENWLKWPQTQASTPLNINDVPSDETLITMSDKFLAEKKIDLSNFGDPYVEKTWRIYYERSVGQDDYAIPDYMSVVYPQKINGQEVYEEWGSPYGIRININIRQKKVSGAWGISTQKYQSSNYAMETDTEKILKLAAGGGYQVYKDETAKVIDIKLGTPTLKYTLVWQYDNLESQQLYVPALVFPIIDMPKDTYFYRENVIIPLAQDILNSRINPELPDPRPMPL